MIEKEFEILLKDTLGVNIETLKEALTSDTEVKVEYKSVTILDEEQLSGLKEKVKKAGYEDGKIAGTEIKGKELKEKYKINIEGRDLDKIMDAYGSMVLKDAKIEPNSKIAERDKSILNLQEQLSTERESWTDKETSYKGQIKGIRKMSDLEKISPRITGLNINQFVTLALSDGLDFDYDESNKLVQFKDGKPVKDNMEKNIPAEIPLTDYATQNGWFDSKGRNGKHEQHGKTGDFKTINDVYAHMEKNNIQPDSPEGEKLIENFNKD